MFFVTKEFYVWRDEHVLREIYKYGWYIDYWMEAGLCRDPYTHNVIDKDYWDCFNNPMPIKNDREKVHICHRTMSTKNPWIQLEISANAVQAHLDHGDFLGSCFDAAQDPEFVASSPGLVHDDHPTTDSNCESVTETCSPVAIISADKLRTTADGPAETEIIGNILKLGPAEKTAKWVINEEAWDCIWDKVIDKNLGPMTFDDRDISQDPNFSVFMLEEMLGEVNRLIDKYSNDPWTADQNANRLVFLLSEHVRLLQAEIDDINSGRRTLSQKDIFGPHERQAFNGKTIEKAIGRA